MAKALYKRLIVVWSDVPGGTQDIVDMAHDYDGPAISNTLGYEQKVLNPTADVDLSDVAEEVFLNGE